MLKRLFTLLPAVCLLISLGGCAGAPPVHTADMPLESQTAPPAPVPTPTPTPAPDPEPPAPTVATLAVCGDVMSHMPVTNDAWDAERGVYDYTPIMAEAEPYVSAADYAVANLETTLAGGPGYSGYPRFHSPDALAYDLKSLGFDLLLTANNHCMDTGFQGLSRTLDVLDEAGLAHVGTSRTLEEAQSDITVADVGGISKSFAVLNKLTDGKGPSASDVAALLDASVAYLCNGAPCGMTPIVAWKAFMAHLTDALHAASSGDTAEMLDSANAAVVAALDVTKMPAMLLGKKEGKQNA